MLPNGITKLRALLAALAAGAALAVLVASRPAQGWRVALASRANAAGSGRAALTQKLEDVFSAPLDALANYVHRIDDDALPNVEMRPTAVAPGTKLDIATPAGPMDITVDSLPDQDGRVQVHGHEGGQLYSGRVKMKSTYGGPGSPLGEVKETGSSSCSIAVCHRLSHNLSAH